jgi:hypothetical protein
MRALVVGSVKQYSTETAAWNHGDHAKAAIDDQVKSGHREKA